MLDMLEVVILLRTSSEGQGYLLTGGESAGKPGPLVDPLLLFEFFHGVGEALLKLAKAL